MLIIGVKSEWQVSIVQFNNVFFYPLVISRGFFSIFFKAAVASRQFLISLQKYQEKSKEIISTLLPRLCLNRYYLAEGVRIYSQETWVITVGQNGKTLVEDNIENFVKYYIECTQVSNEFLVFFFKRLSVHSNYLNPIDYVLNHYTILTSLV